MEFVIEKNRALEMLNFLNLGGMYPEIIIASKNNKIFSSQTETYGFAFRYAVFEKDFFIKNTNQDTNAIKLNYSDMYSAVKNLTEGQLTFSTNDEILYIDSVTGTLSFATKQLDIDEFKEGLIFKMDNGTPVTRSNTEHPVRLDTSIKLKKSEIMRILKGTDKIGAEFKTFKISKDRIILEIGDTAPGTPRRFLYSYNIPGDIINFVKPIESSYTVGLVETLTHLPGNPILQFNNNAAIWISNRVPNYYKFGVLLPPYIPDEEREDESDEN